MPDRKWTGDEKANIVLEILTTSTPTAEICNVHNFYEKDKVHRLVEINRSIEGIHNTGILNDQHYTNLKNEISIFCEGIFSEKIESLVKPMEDKSLDKLSEQEKVKLAEIVKKIKNEISDACSIGIINDLHYSLLTEKLSRYENDKNKQ